MKKIFTLAAVGALATAAFNSAQAQAPITINGQLAATEVAANGYQLVGRFTSPRGFGDAGLLALYAASDANNLYFFVAGTLENNSTGVKNSLQLFIDRPGVAGVPVGTALPVATGAAATSFNGMTARLDLAADIAVAIRGNGTANQIQVEGVAYTSATAGTAAVLTGTTPLTANGTAGTVPASAATGALAGFAGAQVAYTSSANLSSNPGFASNGSAPSNGLEIAVSRTAMGLPAAGGNVQIFALQNNQDGGFLSTDFIPQINPVPTTGTNIGDAAAANFANVPGTQAATLVVTATGLTVLSSKRAEAAAVALAVYPNPASDKATVSYRVLDKAQKVDITLMDLLGRPVRTLLNGVQPVGTRSIELSRQNIAAGSYLIKVQVGDQASTRRVSLL
ncbi:T9SS type A sorting domain-containing protein [Microvirga sp. STR05]|uniref:T9SS type A sorting domain-containing protein n=1 Tax=Hymenobacter duratus TaxID=2771356 RepID=A0ABR8JIC8_9BACT|nr:T9SS type A sorting domain-containing protein [Hymenobacter duratus]MBD2715097.1 T9SS type A sorting domain-containing protein [Hymenobacter duratus]MBR7950003.1 T9SS type A sorting domain-containing protein [Microvirga sp. STR05]